MPFIEEDNLLDLYKKIDKSEANNLRLQDQIFYKNKELSKNVKQRNVFGVVGLICIVACAIIISFSLGVKNTVDKLKATSEDKVVVPIDSLESLKNSVRVLEEKNEQLNAVRDFYLARNLLDGQKIFAVQISAIEQSHLSLLPLSLSNMQLVRNNGFFSFSLGIFETLQEAQNFRYELVKLGFEDVFVVSYKEGKRIQIEEPY
ncbi:SPOR domain-containing protein [Leptobacterium flavescens]|uniref:SPOR domain-containing protein n=1 Tax=Leptobacterium flavescens TaxID=472055 RepID=A0A6P0UMS9_9FLAO|nr:SPOR domain-containing protein [Leptobacterium flavescens]NER13882.1 SPOR domain-containing protein [Leptobacterium flavescens]